MAHEMAPAAPGGVPDDRHCAELRCAGQHAPAEYEPAAGIAHDRPGRVAARLGALIREGSFAEATLRALLRVDALPEGIHFYLVLCDQIDITRCPAHVGEPSAPPPSLVMAVPKKLANQV